MSISISDTPGPDEQVAIQLKSIAKSLESIAKSHSEISDFLLNDLKRFMFELLRNMPSR